MNLRRLSLGFAVFAMVSGTASAQRMDQIEAGVRVRVTPVSGNRVVGSVVSSSADSLVVSGGESGSRLLATSSADIKKLEISNGRSRANGALLKGAMGLGIGAVAGALIGAATYSDDSAGSGFCLLVCSRGQAAGASALVGGTIGVVVGVIAGVVAGRESWTTVNYGPGK